MKAEYANVFIRSAVGVFSQEIGVTLSRKSLVRKSAPVPSLPISIVIGITGAIRCPTSSAAVGQKRMVFRALGVGSRDFIIKPFEPERVLKAIDRLFA